MASSQSIISAPLLTTGPLTRDVAVKRYATGLVVSLLLTGCVGAPAWEPPPLIAGSFRSLEPRRPSDVTAEFSIAAGRADQSLNLYQQQCGRSLRVKSGDLTQVRTNAVSGRLDVD